MKVERAVLGSSKYVNMVLNVHGNHKAYWGRGEGGRGGMEVGGRGRLYTYHYNVTTRMTSALRWAAMRASLMFDNCEGQSHKTVSTGDNFWSERRVEAVSNRGPSAYQPNALPLGQTNSQNSLIVIIVSVDVKQCYRRWTEHGVQSSGPVWRSRWPSCAPTVPYGLCGFKATLIWNASSSFPWQSLNWTIWVHQWGFVLFSVILVLFRTRETLKPMLDYSNARPDLPTTGHWNINLYVGLFQYSSSSAYYRALEYYMLGYFPRSSRSAYCRPSKY